MASVSPNVNEGNADQGNVEGLIRIDEGHVKNHLRELVRSNVEETLITLPELSPYPAVRQRKWAALVHRPFEESALGSIRRSNATGQPYGDPAWVEKLAQELDLDLTIRPRERPRKPAE